MVPLASVANHAADLVLSFSLTDVIEDVELELLTSGGQGRT